MTDDQDDIVDMLRSAAESTWPNHLLTASAKEIERLRECLQHAIDHVGKWQLFTTEEKQRILAEYEKAVRGE